jgi:hypothetical protein
MHSLHYCRARFWGRRRRFWSCRRRFWDRRRRFWGWLGLGLRLKKQRGSWRRNKRNILIWQLPMLWNTNEPP